ncbi:PHD finger protein ALFIN-LIKE 4-like [Oryza brachyantha]|uniref:PHD finger protein ALFIN-LIKE 4-like n=1 Tax=Oryza brachyantha TaxID=4533 RepID=UPI0003EAA2A9|nr:PHD finger protein ALFIN-LIKE 4-like [Oryza brachyantha]
MDDGYGSVTIVHDARSPEDVFQDFRSRRAGIVKALTTDVEKFYELCDPEKENLCLYGMPNETWEVSLPADEVPPELPEPALGINFARDGMDEKDWLSLVAVHSDSWLLSVAFYFGARFGFDKEARKQLFAMISTLPTVFEVVSGSVKKQSKTANNSSKNKAGSKPPKKPSSDSKPPKQYTKDNSSRGNGGHEDQGETSCGACGEAYTNGEFWICCDICETWFHGECVRITPAKAQHIKHYKCPNCSHKRGRE